MALKRTKPPNSHRPKLPLKPLNGSGTADGDRRLVVTFATEILGEEKRKLDGKNASKKKKKKGLEAVQELGELQDLLGEGEWLRLNQRNQRGWERKRKSEMVRTSDGSVWKKHDKNTM